MMSEIGETKTLNPGEWWVRNYDGAIVFICGADPDGDPVFMDDDEELRNSTLRFFTQEYHHEPRCTGFDWLPVERGTLDKTNCEDERHRAWKSRTWLIDWHRHIDRPDRPTRFHHWPIRIGWQRKVGHSLICWHSWPMAGSTIWPDATYKHCGWTIHVGALKIKFGR